MNFNDQPKLGEVLEELCGIYNRPYTDTLVGGYYRVLKDHSFPAIRQAIVQLMGDGRRKQVMPMPAEIKAVAPQYERAMRGVSFEEERWRRRYDVWQQGRFSNEALEVAFKLSDAELGLDTSGNEEQAYLRCQQPGCVGLISWPTDRTDEGRMFCPAHQPIDSRSHPVTTEEKQAILEKATPAAKSFLRSIDVIAKLMTDIPVTPAEQAITDADAVPLRARVFEEKAEGPGVNPGVFLNDPHLSIELPSDYRERREIVAAAGWKFNPGDGVWKRGKRALTEETIDRFPSLDILQEYVGRR